MDQNSKKTNATENTPLPVDTNVDNIEKIIDAISRRPGNVDAIKSLCSIKDSSFNDAKASLETLNIIEGYNLTELGHKIAYDTEHKNLYYLNAIMNFAPYEHFLLYLSSHGEFSAAATSDAITKYWGLNKKGSTAYNRERAVSTFGSFAQLAGLGKIIIGRKGKSTRIEWSTNTSEIIKNYENPIAIQEIATKPNVDLSTANANSKSLDVQTTNANVDLQQLVTPLNSANLRILPNITIEVNMNDWDIEKIKSFFKYAYGDFSDDRKEEN